MNTFSTMDQLLEQARAWNERLSDDIVDSPEISFTKPFDIQYISRKDRELFKEAIYKVATRATLNDRAFSQLCGRLSVPPKWASDSEKCPADLRETIMNWKLAHEDKKGLMVRLCEAGERLVARAVLSDQYTPYDNFQFCEALEQAVITSGLDVEVFRPEVGDYFRAYLIIKGIDFETWSSMQHERPVGDRGGNGGLRPAIYVSNNEVGGGRVRVAGGLFRSYCVNGLIVGWQAEDAFAIVHRWKTKKHMALYVNEAIASAMRMSEDAAVKFLDLQAVKLEPAKVGDILDDWVSKYGLTIANKELWAKACDISVREHGEISMFDVINEATYSASKIENSDTREMMERMAGDMIYAPVPDRYRALRREV